MANKLKIKKGVSLETPDITPEEELDETGLDDNGEDDQEISPEEPEDSNENEDEDGVEMVAMVHQVKEGVMRILDAEYEIIDYVVHVLPEHVQDCISHGLTFKD